MIRTNTTPTTRSALEDRLTHYAEKGVDAINERLAALDCEWTAGRLVKATTGLVIVIGFALAALVDPIWMLLPAVAGAFLVQYLFFCRSPLAEIFQRAGFRPGHEIDNERLGLRTLRGDFRHLPTVAQVEDRDAVTRLESEGGPALDISDDLVAPREAAALISAATH